MNNKSINEFGFRRIWRIRQPTHWLLLLINFFVFFLFLFFFFFIDKKKINYKYLSYSLIAKNNDELIHKNQ